MVEGPIVHFCFGMTRDFGGRPFSLSHYLAVRSAWEVILPSRMILHCRYVPEGEWWERACEMLEVHRVPEIDGIFGFPAKHPAHRADIVRLAALLSFGGVYLDLDVMVVRSFDGIRSRGFTASLEIAPDGCPVGLCNAIILAEPGSQFAKLCLEGHDPARSLWEGFRSNGRDENYVEYSLRYPALLADLCPGMVTVLSRNAFLWAGWDEAGLKKLFEEDVEVPEEVRCIHLWESHSWEPYLRTMNEDTVKEVDTTYNRFARPLLSQNPSRGKRDGQRGDLDFGPMDRLCRDSGFVYKDRSGGSGLGGWLRKQASKARDGWFVPLRSRLDRIEQRVDAICNEVEGSGGSQPQSLIRYLDSSLEIELDLEGTCPGPSIFVSGGGWMPEGYAKALSRAGAGSIWVITDLKAAYDQRNRQLARRSGIRVVYSPRESEAFRNTISEALPGAKISLLAMWGEGSEYFLWEALADYEIEKVAVMANPLFPAEGVFATPEAGSFHPSGAFWGASVAALDRLAQRHKLGLRSKSSDSYFLCFGKKEGEEFLPRTNDCDGLAVPVTTLYGQSLLLPIREARDIFADELVEDLKENVRKPFCDCPGFPW